MRRMKRESGNILVSVISGLAVVALALSIFLFFQNQREHNIRLEKERQVANLIQERDQLQIQITTLETAKSKVEAELDRTKQDLMQAKAQADHSQQELSRSIDEKKGEMGKLQQAMDQMMKELAQARSERQDLSGKVAKLTSDREDLQKQLEDAHQQHQMLQAKLNEAVHVPTVQLDKVTVSSAEQEPAPLMSAMQPRPIASSVLAGQVLVVNRDYDFVVVDLGKNQGLSMGQEFKIVRGDEVLGRVKIEKVYDDLSAAAMLADTKKEAIREGDSVRAL